MVIWHENDKNFFQFSQRAPIENVNSPFNYNCLLHDGISYGKCVTTFYIDIRTERKLREI